MSKKFIRLYNGKPHEGMTFWERVRAGLSFEAAKIQSATVGGVPYGCVSGEIAKEHGITWEYVEDDGSDAEGETP